MVSFSKSKKLKLFFNCVEGTGHLNACIGFAQTLAQNGHECVFVVNESLTKMVEKYGFRVIPLKQLFGGNEFQYSENPAKDFAGFLQKSGVFSNMEPWKKFEIFTEENSPMQGSIDLMIAFNPQIEQALIEEKPDAWIYDHLIVPPAVKKTNIPYILLCSAAPLMYLNSPLLPPACSGFPLDDKSQWNKFDSEKIKQTFIGYQTKVDEHFGVKTEQFEHAWRSPFLNVYQYPIELDYHNVEGFTIPENFVGVDTFVRKDPEPFKLPEEFAAKTTESDKLIYLSLGSMGGFDIDLMQKILGILSKLPYKVIVSKGPRGDEYELPDNCWGANFLPQPEIVEIVDLVITHGGNNTFTETFAAGRKMIVMGLFGDQPDNSMRLQETGYGIKIEPYDFTEQQLIDAIEKLMNDKELEAKLKAAKKRIASSTRREEAAKKVEEFIAKHYS